MSEFYFIDRENMPCLYEIGWEKRDSALILKIHRSIIATCPNLAKSFWVPYFIREFGFQFFDQFKKDLFGDLYFGFDRVCRKIGEEKDFLIFEILIPQIKKQTNEACHYCNGTGRSDNFSDGKCLSCDGCGRKVSMDWKKIEAISASLVIFFNLISLRLERGKETDSNFLQLILIDAILDKGMHGGGLGGVYSILLSNFLASFPPNTEIMEMKKAMESAYEKMYGKLNSFDKLEINIRIADENGWLNIGCPGNACGLHPADSWGPKKGQGYKFSCHNVDTAAQQIILIVGLAALCDKYRKEVENR